MKKVFSFLMVLLLCILPATPAGAAAEGPVITLQPQSPYYSPYSVAVYTVKADGSNLTATWYIEYDGKTYNASKLGGSMQPWEAYAGESYGAKKTDDNTFCFVFEGIESELSGAKIWCEIEDGHNNVTSQAAHITVGNFGSPPEILSIPSQITVKQGQEAEIRCVAKSSDGAQLEFLWYETPTGNFEDMQAINRGRETCDFLFCDTDTPGTCYYICGITTSEGGMAYSSMVQVNVVADTVAAPKIETETLPNATVGVQYAFQLKCTDPDVEFFPYYNPGTENALEDGSWLGLSADGWLMGTPTEAGTYSFSVCAMGAGGEDYGVYTLTVVEANNEDSSVPTEPTAPTKPTATQPTSPTPVPTPEETQQPEGSIAWWVLVLVALGAAAIGVVVAVILSKKANP